MESGVAVPALRMESIEDCDGRVGLVDGHKITRQDQEGRWGTSSTLDRRDVTPTVQPLH